MRNAQENPLYQTFGHLLPENKRYPQKWVDIYWNYDETGKCKDVEVVFKPVDVLECASDQSVLFAAFAKYYSNWLASLGCSNADWLKRQGFDPAYVFGRLIHHGFASDDELRRAVEEFAHIDECVWARQMMRGMDRRT